MEQQKELSQEELNFFKKNTVRKENVLLEMLFYSSLTMFIGAIFLHTFNALLPYKLVALLVMPLISTSTSGLLIWLNIKALLFVKQLADK